MMCKSKLLGVIAVTGLVCLPAVAQTFVDTYDAVDGITTRDNVSDPYVYNDPVSGDTGVVGDTTNSAQFYFTMDVPFNVTDANPLDFSGGSFDISLMCNSPGTLPGNPADPNVPVCKFWVRFYSGTYDANTGEWAFGGAQNYYFEYSQTDGFQTFTRNCVDFDETDGFGGIFDETSVYKVRFDTLLPEGAQYHPTTFGIGHFALYAGPGDPPVANAGMDQLGLINPNPGGLTITLDGSGSTDNTGIVQYTWKQGRDVIATSTEPTVNLTLGGGTYEYELTVEDEDYQTDRDTVTIEITDDITPLLVDNVETDFGIFMGDIYGRGSSSSIPVTFDESSTLEVLNQVVGAVDAPAFPSHWVFDADGNLYYSAWNGNIISYTKDLALRWEAPVSTLHGDAQQSTGPIVGERYLYAVGRSDVDPDPNVAGDEYSMPKAFAYNKATGELVWDVDLAPEIGGVPTPVEPDNWHAKKVLYDNYLYIIGATGTVDGSGSPADGKLWVYIVDCGTDVTPGSLKAAVNLDMKIQSDVSDSQSGNLLIVPDAFGTGMHGLYWGEWTDGVDGFGDYFGAMADPASGTVVEIWNAEGTIYDGPRSFRTQSLYSPVADMIFTPGYWDFDLDSIMVWDPQASDGQFDDGWGTVPYIYGVYREGDGGNHGHAQVNMLEDFTGVTRVHCHGDDSKLVSYTVVGDGSDPNNLVTTKVLKFPRGAHHLNAHGAVLWDDVNERAVLVSSTKVAPATLMAMDLEQPAGSDPETGDGPVYIDNVVVTIDGTPVAVEDFEGFADGYEIGNDPDWDIATANDPLHVPTVMDVEGNKVLVFDPSDTDPNTDFGTETAIWMPAGLVDIAPTNRVTLEWDQYRLCTKDNIDVYMFADPNDPAHANFGVFQWDLWGAIWYTNVDGWIYGFGLTTDVWQHVKLDANNGTCTFTLDASTDDETSTYTQTYTFDRVVFDVYATPPTCRADPLINLWEDPDPINPNSGAPWSFVDRGPVPGPDGSFYMLQFETYDRKFTRVGVAGFEPEPGACCLGDANSTCVVTTQSVCENSYGGTFQGQGVLCTPTNPCAPSGCPGDCDCDGDIDYFDINYFLQAINGEQAWIDYHVAQTGSAPTCTYLGNCDVDQDGSVDYFDINPFLDAIGTSCP